MHVFVLFVIFGLVFAVASVEQHNEHHQQDLKEKSHEKHGNNIHQSEVHHQSGRHHHSEQHHQSERHHPSEQHHQSERHHHSEQHHQNERHHPSEQHHQSERHHHSEQHHQNERHHPSEQHHQNERHHPSEQHHLKHEVKHYNHHQSSHFSHHGYRVHETNRDCHWVCNENPNNGSSTTELGLKVFYNTSSSLFAFESTSSKIAIIINYSSNIIILINGGSGVTIIFVISSQQVIRLQQSPNTQDVLWNPSNKSFEEYLANLSVSTLLKVGQQYGQKSQLSNLPQNVSKEIEESLEHLGIPFSYKDIIQYLTTFASYFKNVLGAIYKGSGSFNIQNNFNWFLKINIFLANLLDPANSGIDLSKVQLDPRTIFQGSSGIEVFVKLFSQIGRNVDLSKLAGSLFTSREKVLKFFSQVSSGSHNGLDGLITILVNVAKALSGQGSITEVISSILKFNGTDLNEPTYAQVIDQGLELCRTQQTVFHNGASFEGIYRFLKALVDNNLFLNSVNICDIIKIFFSPNPLDRIQTIIKVCSTFSPDRGIPQFFKFINDVLNGTGNASILSGLVPGLNISQFGGNGSSLQNILQGRNLTQLFSSGGNISSIFSNVPIYGPIAAHLQSLFNGSLGNLTQGGWGGISSGIQKGIQDFVNSTHGGAGFGGIASGVQNGIGSLIGIGGNATGSTPQPSNETVAPEPETSSVASSDSSDGAETSSAVTEPEASSAVTDGSTGGSHESSAVTDTTSSGPEATGGSSNLFGLRGAFAGGFAGDLNFHNRHHKAEHKNHHHKSEEKVNGKI